MKKGRVAVFLSGRGTNFEAIYKSSISKDSNFEVFVVISDKKKAKGLKKAKDLKIKSFHISLNKFQSKNEYEKQIIKILNKNKIELICLAGYMKIVGEELLKEYKNRIINIHPALLPSFPGLNSQAQALNHGIKVTGCTVHFVDSGVDTGPIILQKSVKVKENDTEETLSKRILKQEHKIYSKTIRLFFENRLKIKGRKVIIINK